MLNWKKVESLEEPLEIDCTLSKKGVYLRKDIQKVEDKYVYQEVLLSNEYRYPILDMDEYKAKLLETFKEEAQEKNKKVLAAKETIVTSIGEFSIKTPTYDFIFCLMALKEFPSGIPEGKIRFANGEAAPAMTQGQVQALYFEFANAIAELDAKFTGIKNEIDAAENIDALESIEINY